MDTRRTRLLHLAAIAFAIALVTVWTGPSAGEAAPMETLTLAVLLRAPGMSPSVEDVVQHDYVNQASKSPILSFRQVTPSRVRPPNPSFPRGDYAHRLSLAPDSTEAKLERYVYADFADVSQRNAALNLLASDAAIELAYPLHFIPIAASSAAAGALHTASPEKSLVYGQYHLQTLSLPGAWAAAGGWGLVGVLDNGVDAEHPELRSSSSAQSVGGTRIPGGNFLPYFSRNVGGRSQPPDLLDELQPSWFVHAYEIECDDDDGAVDGKLNMSLAGHGTHVAGLIAANGNDLAGVQGTCRNCGIAAVKRTATFCSLETPHTLRLGNTPDVDAEGIEHLYKSGAQVINMSFSNNETNCQAASNNRLCGALSTAWKHDLLMVASAGNARRNELWFPARDPRVASIGGIDSGGNFWDESPGDFSKCPFSGDSECGSNAASDTGAFTKARQELVAPAKSVRSTFYRGALWNPVIGCGDGYPADDSASSDGFGFCTGTSMSAPIVAGLYGLLRSINPLMRAGDPVNQATPLAPDGIRDIVAKTASRSQAGQPEDRKLGFGIPNAGAAVAAMLGVVRGKPVKNRATPLFGLHSNGGRDHAAVSTPQ